MKDTGTLGLAVLLVMSQTVCAQTGGAIDRLKTCSQFEGMERLKCVDELLGEMTETHATTPSPSPNWIISETTSPVDYQPQIEALMTARTASQNAASAFAIHCRAHRTELIISTTGSWKPVPDGEVKVAHRINEEPVVEQRWRALETGKGLAFPGDVVRLIRSMPDGGQLLVKVHVGKGPPYESTFQLVGLNAVRRKMATACNWPAP